MPEQYQLVPLGELAELHMGATPSRIEPSYWAHGQSGEPWVAIRDIHSKFTMRTSETITFDGVRAARMRRVEPGTPIMSFKLSLGRATIPTVPVYTNEAIVCLKAKNGKSDARWLYHAVPVIAKSAVAETAIKGKTLNLDKLKRLPIPTPGTLAEQCRIAEILDAADERVAAMQAVVVKRLSTMRGLMRDSFVMAGKESAPLGSLAATFSGGTPARDVYEYFDGKIPWLKSGEVNQESIREAEESITPLALASCATRLVHRGNPIVAMYGATAGKVSWLEIDCAINQAILAVVASNPDLLPRWLYWYLVFSGPRLVGFVQGSGQPNLSKAIIDKLPVPVVAVETQLRDSFVLNVAQQEIVQVREDIAKQVVLRKALMDDLLTGRKRVPVGPEG